MVYHYGSGSAYLRASGGSRLLWLYAGLMCAAVLGVLAIGRMRDPTAQSLLELPELATKAVAEKLGVSHHPDHLTKSLLEQGAELEDMSVVERHAQKLDLRTERAILRAKQDRKDSALKLAKAAELVEAARNESALSKQASKKGHFFDKSVLSEHAQLDQVKADIKAVERKRSEARLSASRAHKIMQTTISLSSRSAQSVDLKRKKQKMLLAQAATQALKAKALRKRAKKLEVEGGTPEQMIADVEVSKLRDSAKHADQRAHELRDRAANLRKEIGVLSPSAAKTETEGNDVAKRYDKKLAIERYYAKKVLELKKQKHKIEALFDHRIDDGSSLLARASSSKRNAMQLWAEAQKLQNEGHKEAHDADKQEAIARKYRNAAMRLRVSALAKQQAKARAANHVSSASAR